MFNLPGVIIGMVHYLLPINILILYSAMKGIDLRLLQAAKGLGANPLRAFLTIFVPLSLPGLRAAALLIFVLALGFFVTPALLGGRGGGHDRDAGEHVFLRDTRLGLRLCPRRRAAGHYHRGPLLPFCAGARARAHRAAMSHRFDPFVATRFVPWLFVGLVLFFLAAPLLVVIPAAFNDPSLLQFPPKAWSLRWFHAYFSDKSWIAATEVSVKAGLVVALLSTVLGLGTAVVLDRFAFFGRTLVRALVLEPLVAPVVVPAVALYVLFLHIGLNGSFTALVIGHTVMTFPYATVVIGASLAEVDRQLENAAVGLGASWSRAFCEVTLPLIRPGLVVSALFGFLISFDEVVVAIFVTGPATFTLPRRIWEGIRFDLNPTIAAVATLLVSLSAVVLLSSEFLRRWLKRTSGGSERSA